ncbi:phage tail protein [Vagococcus carniphilus]|uniref:phage tail protein n=1 Tax=Vagococcus carniphilus TaxID=218144 RepID=UPI00288E5266|nr:tape measure protein [Vagococcus carniphilus]
MILDESGFSAGMDKAVKQLGKFDGQVENTSQRGGRSLGGIWTSFVGNFLASGATKIISTGIGMITSSVDGAINRVDTLNNSNRVFENMGFNAKETASTMEALKQSINGLPTPLDGAIQGVQLLASSTNDLGKSEQIFSALNNGILGFGGNAEMVDNAIIQLSQSFSNGKVDAQTWNSMINSGLGPALNALAKQMGITTGAMKEGLSEGSISVEQFQDALIDLNKNGGGGLKSLEQIAKDSTSGIKTGIANMKTAVVRGVAEAIVKIDEGLSQYGTSISQILADIGSGFESGLKTAAEKIPPIMKAISDAFAFVKENGDWLIPILVGLTSAFIGLGAVNKVASTISSISSALGILKGAAVFLVSGPGLAIVGISLLIAAGVALYKNWDEVSKYAKKIWGDLSKYFKETFDNIKKWFSETWTGFKDKVKEASDGVKNAWNGTKQWFSDLWEGVKQSTSNKWNKIKELFSPYVEGILSVFEPMIEWFGTLWETIKTITGAAWEIIKSVIMAPVLFIIDLITGDFTQLKEDMNMIWTNIKEQASIIWEALKQYFFKTIEAIVQTAINLWNSFLDGVVIIWESIVKIGKDIWNLFKNWLIETITKIVNGAKEKWENLKKETVGTFNKLVDGAKQAWEDLKQSVRDVVDRVTGTFDKLSDIDLWEAGKAIIDGFIKGLQQKWEDGKKFVSGIGDWIRKNKGPIEYDRKLLVNNGMAIMDGLNKGIRSGFEAVKTTVRGAAGELNKEFDSNLDTPQFNVTGKASVVSKPNETVLANDLPSNKTKQGDVFNINLQSLGELSEVQLMRMAEQLVKYIKDVKDREDAPKGGPVYGI